MVVQVILGSFQFIQFCPRFYVLTIIQAMLGKYLVSFSFYRLCNWALDVIHVWSPKAAASSDQNLVLFHKKEFKGKMNSKQGSSKAKVHTQGVNAGLSEREGERKREKMRKRERDRRGG